MRLTMRDLLSFVAGICCISMVAFAVLFFYGSSSGALFDAHLTSLPFTPSRLIDHNTLRLVEEKTGGEFSRVDCVINDDVQSAVNCFLNVDSDQVYVPFSFISSYFEVTGKLEQHKSHDGNPVFNWQHSYAKLTAPKLPYQTDGIFMSFDSYNVEARDRVRYISADEGVPVSSQWSATGHYYPIQIAQFALSHYSKNITAEPARLRVVADFQHDADDLSVSDSDSADYVDDEERKSRVLSFCSTDEEDSPGISLTLPDGGEPYLKFWIKFTTKGSVSVILEGIENDERSSYEINYKAGHNMVVQISKNRIEYGLGTVSDWKLLVRDVYVDLIKGLTLKSRKSTANKKDKLRSTFSRLRMKKLILRGEGYLDDVILASSAHSELFYTAANWLAKNQDARGGWPIMVKRKLGQELQPGWYSAMAQGQAMSALVRAFLISGEEKYLHSATRSLDLFFVNASQGGVRASFVDRYTWFEEYPTTPSSFVLNGFIYAIMGLYDLVKTVRPGAEREKADVLLRDGMTSLLAMLPLYDTGSGSIYDLRHFTMGGPPNLARWDYHAVHVIQLMVLDSIHPHPVLAAYVDRWTAYMKGHRAPHN